MQSNNQLSTPLVSIIITCYNAGKFLPKCFDCLKNQTYKNLQVIFVNDGSEDQSLGLIRDFCKENSYAEFIDGENKGVGHARRVGLEKVKGEYFTFYDADDVISPFHIETLVKTAVDTHSDLTVCGFKRIKSKKACCLKFRRPSQKKIELFTREEAISQYFSQKKFDYILWNKLYSTKTLTESGATFIDCRYGEESFFCYHFLKSVKKVAYVKEKTYLYVQWKSSLMHLEFNQARLDIIKNLELVEKDSENYSESARNYLSSMRSGYIVGLLFFIKKSNYNNPTVIKSLIETLKLDVKRLKKCKKTALYRRLFIPLIPTIAKVLFRKRLK